MIKQVLLVALLSGAATAASAQSNFRPGYILPLTGDTIRGQVDERSEQRNTRLCTFRPASGPEAEYTPAQLRGYGFGTGRHYETQVLPAPLDKLTAAFLERLVQGPASLYTLQDVAGNEHFYLRMATAPLQELTQTTGIIERDNQRYRSTDKAFQRTLAHAFQSCPAMQASLSGVLFSAGSLTKAVAKYNTCTGATEAVVATGGRTNKVRLRVLGGVESSTLAFDGGTFDQQSFKGSAAPLYGLSLLFSPRALNLNFGISLDAIYSTFKSDQIVMVVNTSSYTKVEQQARFNINHLRLPLLLRYTYVKGPVRPFLAAGVEVGFITKRVSEFRSPSLPTWIPFDNYISTRSSEQALIGAIGLTTARETGRNISLELRAGRSNGFSQSVGIGTSFTRFAALLAVDLTK